MHYIIHKQYTMKNFILIYSLLISCIISAQKKIRVACVGDSVTFGMGIDNPETNSYPSQLQILLGNQYEVGNFGKSGATLLAKGHRPYIEQEEYQKAMTFAGDLVVIHLGLNDTDPRNWVNYRDTFIQDYLNLIQDFRSQNPKAKIWICRMTPITHAHRRFQSGTRDWYWQIQETIEQIAKVVAVELIDLQEPLYNRPDLLPDALHPNKEGASLIANAVYSAITGNYGGLQLPAIYSDNMVLQRKMPLSLEGIANAGDEVTLSIEKESAGSKKSKAKPQIVQQVKVKTASNGKWNAIFTPFEAGIGYQLRISTTKKSILYKNIAFGDVFLCSGQSNMAWKLANEATFDKNTDYSDVNIRIFDMKPRREMLAQEWELTVLDSINRLEYYKSTSWQSLTNENAPDFSAVAYFFGKEISRSENIPIGLIQNAIGGSNLESWVDRKTLEFEFPEIMRDWIKNDFLMDWVRERASQNVKLSEGKARHPYEPSYLFASGILPLKKYPISGVVWYQGESNAHNIETFERLFPLFVNSWRGYFANEKLPFYVVQLSSINRPTWGYFRDAQRRLSKMIPNIYMAISSDLGHPTDVHPRQKKQVGERLALWALHTQYGRNVSPYSAEYKSVESKNGIITIDFGSNETLKTSDGKVLQGFELAEIEGMYTPASAEIITGGKVRISSEKVKNPKYVRYNYAPFANGNLINAQNLPTSTFKVKISE